MASPHDSHEQRPADDATRAERQAAIKQRTANLRTLAVAGTLASVGGFTVLAAGATHTAATSRAADSTQLDTQAGANASSAETGGYVTAVGPDGTTDEYFVSPQGASIAPPQSSFGQGGGSNMSGGS